ncbi:hypothetical protein [Stutzerimonas tarimensis]|uniref:Uncharacterized protein n=1 Tax=Stutzerimonas tarimensis TaxID=1507735 RepID=A0ABV7T8G5_9GAMM
MNAGILGLGVALLFSTPVLAGWLPGDGAGPGTGAVLAYQYDPRSPYSQHPAPRREMLPQHPPRYQPYQVPRQNPGISRDPHRQMMPRQNVPPARLKPRRDQGYAPPSRHGYRQAPPPGVYYYPPSYPSNPSYRFYRN